MEKNQGCMAYESLCIPLIWGVKVLHYITNLTDPVHIFI